MIRPRTAAGRMILAGQRDTTGDMWLMHDTSEAQRDSVLTHGMSQYIMESANPLKGPLRFLLFQILSPSKLRSVIYNMARKKVSYGQNTLYTCCSKGLYGRMNEWCYNPLLNTKWHTRCVTIWKSFKLSKLNLDSQEKEQLVVLIQMMMCSWPAAGELQ